MGDPVRELDPRVYADLDDELDRAAGGEYDDWDAFWASQAAPVRPALIRGVKVTPPIDMPISTLRRVEAVVGSTSEQDHKDLLGLIFGADVFDTWESNGMGIREMQVVLAWAGAHMRGTACTFEEALRIFEEAQAEREREGKARPPKPPKGPRGRSSRRR